MNEVDTAIRVLAAESPDYVYNSTGSEVACHYDRACGGKEGPGCIFGQAFQRLGASLEEATQVSIHELWLDTHKNSIVPVGWSTVQVSQDHGSTWGEVNPSLTQQQNDTKQPTATRPRSSP